MTTLILGSALLYSQSAIQKSIQAEKFRFRRTVKSLPEHLRATFAEPEMLRVKFLFD